MREILHKLQIRYELLRFRFQIFWQDIKDEAKALNLRFIHKEQQRDLNAERYKRGISKMTKALSANPLVWKQSGKDLLEAANGRTKNSLEINEEMALRRKLISGRKMENEIGMSNTFVANQAKYRLQIRRQAVYKHLKKALKADDSASILIYETELKELRKELEGFNNGK